MQNKRIVPDIPSFDFYTKEAMNILRGNIQMAGYNINVIALTSAKAHEGKSSTSFQLAKSLAGLNKKVVYLDSDIRSSKTKQRYKIMEKTVIKNMIPYMTNICKKQKNTERIVRK